MNFISKNLIYLSKKVTRQKIYPFIKKHILKFNQNEINVLNIGAGGEIETYIKKFNNIKLISIDNDYKRNPDILVDVSSEDFLKNIEIKPQLITCFEVLEHLKEPQKAIDNLYNISEKNTKIILSVPFLFPIHDLPNDFYRYTKFGLQHLFKKFSYVKIENRDGWLDTIFILFIRLKFSKHYLLKIVSIIFLLSYFILYPLFNFIQRFIKFENITSGYLIEVKK